MIAAIETSPSMDVTFGSHEQLFFYDMYLACEYKKITPNEFRNISSSDWNAIKDIHIVFSDKIELWRKQKEMEEKMKAEAQRRFM